MKIGLVVLALTLFVPTAFARTVKILTCDNGHKYVVNAVLPMQGTLISFAKQELDESPTQKMFVCTSRKKNEKYLILPRFKSTIAAEFPLEDDEARPVSPASQALIDFLYGR